MIRPPPSGPYAGRAADGKELGEDQRRYFKDVGWDESGIPKSSTLERLGLEDVDNKIRRLFG